MKLNGRLGGGFRALRAGLVIRRIRKRCRQATKERGGRRGASLRSLWLVIPIALAASAAGAVEDYRLLRLDGHLVKWGRPALGAGATVTYAFVAGPMHFADARNCRDLVPLDSLLAASGISAVDFRRETRAALTSWEAVSGIGFRWSADPSAADILIGAQARPRRWAFADVSYSPSGAGEVRRIERSLICLNPEKPWKIGLGGDPDIYGLRYVLTHEAGHAIGLDHAGSHGQLMSFRYQAELGGLQAGDASGAAALYSSRSSATATAPVEVDWRHGGGAAHSALFLSEAPQKPGDAPSP